MDWFTSDLHLGHWNINKHCNRGFTDCNKMDETLISNINSKVQANDTLYILGDFAWWKCFPFKLNQYRNGINCKNCHLILGNHDEPIKDKLNSLFCLVENILEINLLRQGGGSTKIVMCHYAMRTWNQSHRGSYHLYGHSHGNLPDDPNSLSFDVGVDAVDQKFFPVNLDDIEKRMKLKTWKSPFEE